MEERLVWEREGSFGVGVGGGGDTFLGGDGGGTKGEDLWKDGDVPGFVGRCFGSLVVVVVVVGCGNKTCG